MRVPRPSVSMCPAERAFHGKFWSPKTTMRPSARNRFVPNALSRAFPSAIEGTRWTFTPRLESMSRADQRQKSGSSYSMRGQNTTGMPRRTRGSGCSFQISVG